MASDQDSRAANLAPWRSQLPDPSMAAQGGDQDIRARAVLAILLDRAADPALPALPALHRDPHSCPNCGVPASSEKSPYCGTACREEAAFVRQVRTLLRSELLHPDAERQASMGQVLWRVLGGGYPRRQALLPAKGVERLFAREAGKCQSCGQPATTFDHIGSG